MNREWREILPMLHDTHCHVNLYPDQEPVREQIAADGMRVVHVTTSPAEFVDCRASQTCDTIELAAGLVPQDILKLAPDVDMYLELLETCRFVGEIGLDYVTKDEQERLLQRQVFERILGRCADLGGRVLTIHSRRAAGDVIDMLRGFSGTPILHWFSGAVQEIESAPENLYFSLNTAMVKSRRGRDLIEAMNPDRLLLETDGPFVEVGDRPAVPRDVHLVVEFLAKQWACGVVAVAARLSSNFARAIG